MAFNGYSTFCFHSSVDGHLDGFHILAIINNAPMNMYIPVFEYLPSILLGIPMSGFAGLYRKSMFNSFRNYHTTFQKRLHHFTFPPSMYEGSNFSTSSPILVIVWLLLYLFCVNKALTYIIHRKFQFLHKKCVEKIYEAFLRTIQSITGSQWKRN